MGKVPLSMGKGGSFHWREVKRTGVLVKYILGIKNVLVFVAFMVNVTIPLFKLRLKCNATR